MPPPAVMPKLPLPTSGTALDLARVWESIRKFWATALIVAVGVELLVSFWTLSRVRVYRADATIEFDPNPPRPLGKGVDTVVDLGSGGFWDNREYYETQYKILQSMHLAAATVNALHLDRDDGFLRMLPPGAPPKSVTSPVTIDEAADVLRSRLTISPVKDSRLAIVSLDDADPARAQRILSELVNTYVEQNLDSALESTSAATDWLHGQLDSLKNELETSEMALHTYKQDRNILSVDMDAQSNMLREEMKQLNDTLTTVRTHREELLARRDQLRRVPADDPTILPASELLQSPLLQQLRQHNADAGRDRAALLAAGKGTNHPDVLAATAKVEATRQALLAEVTNIRGAVERDVATVEQQERGLAGLYENAKTRALALNLMEIEYNRLRRTKENNEKLYSMLLERTKETDLSKMLRANNVRVVDPALEPRDPVRPRVPVNLALGAALGLLLGALAATSRALLDRTVKTPADVENDLELPFLGLMPMISDSRLPGRRRRRDRAASPNADLIVHHAPRSGPAEAARAIRTNLLFMAPDNPYRTLLITSSGPSEGKTTVACAIAIAMAQAGQRVLLLDCDLRKPRLHRIFGHTRDVGVTTVLLDPSTLDAAITATEVPRLDVLTAGPVPPNPAELLQSDRFRSLLALLAERYDRVLIDSPPAAAVTDPALLSRVVDATVIVVRSYRTPRDLARHGIRAIVAVGGHAAGVVLNAVDLNRHEYKYYHYYYAKPGYVYGPPETGSDGTDAASSTPIQ